MAGVTLEEWRALRPGPRRCMCGRPWDDEESKTCSQCREALAIQNLEDGREERRRGW